MRKFTLFLATIMMLVMVNVPTYANSQIQGDGSEENPFLIENISQLSIINDFPDMCFKLVSDIDFSNGSWTTVGTQGDSFSGIFDGNNHSFLNISTVIFQTNNGEIRNLLIENSTSMFVDTNKGVIKNCGIMGNCNCYSSFGLIAYYNYKNAVIDSCYSKGSITASIVGSSGNLGGICGFNNGTIRNCYSGVAISGEVSSSYSYYGNTQIPSDGTMMIGNIVGRNAGAVEKCFGYGNITYSVGSHYSGAHEDIYCGGLIGYTEGSVSDSYFNSDEVICNNTGIGSPKTTLGLKIRSTYENWDFENTWAIDPDYNDGYPYLRWERETSPESTSLNIKLGDYMEIGTYYNEPILWRCVSFEKISGYDTNGNPIMDPTDTVTEYEDGYLPLMIADRIICLKAFDASGYNTTGSHYGEDYRQQRGSNRWYDSNIRCWLNSNETAGNVTWKCGNPPDKSHVRNGYPYDNETGFLTNFREYEKEAIMTSTQFVGTYSNNVFNLFDSSKETDTIFLLNNKQINNIQDNSSVLGEGYYIGIPTTKCVQNASFESTAFGDTLPWYTWLRSPDTGTYRNVTTIIDRDNRVCSVERDGSVGSGAYLYTISAYSVDVYGANSGRYGIRPAFFLDLSNVLNYSGTGAKENPIIIDDSAVVYSFFDDNDNEILSEHIKMNSKITPPTDVTKFGYYLVGWSTEKNAKTPEYALNEEITITENTNFYPVWESWISDSYDGGYYTESDINPMSEITDGILSFTANFADYKQFGFYIEKYGFFVYNFANESKKATIETDSLNDLNKAKGKFTTSVSVPTKYFSSQVVAKPFVIISGDTVWGDTMITSVAQIDKWLGSKTNTQQ